MSASTKRIISSPMPAPVPKPEPVTVSGSDAAPVVFVDGAVAYGIINGVIQIETAMNLLVPGNDAKTKTRILVTSHLRGSIGGMIQLRDALSAAIEMAMPKPPETKVN